MINENGNNLEIERERRKFQKLKHFGLIKKKKKILSLYILTVETGKGTTNQVKESQFLWIYSSG